MPNYDFRCKDCEHKFSMMVSIAEKDTVKCPKCGSSNIIQLFTGFSVGGSKSRASECTGSCNTGG